MSLWPLFAVCLFFLFSFFSLIAVGNTLPWVGFENQAFAVVAVFFLALSFPFEQWQLRINSLSWFWIIFIFFALITHGCSYEGFRQNVLMAIFYASLALLICSLPIFGNEKLLHGYLYIILFAGLLNAVVVGAQKWDVQYVLPFSSAVFNTEKNSRPYGNLAQPNLVATLMLCAWLCAFYFYKKKYLSFLSYAALTLIFSGAIYLTGSRTAILIFGTLCVVALLLRDWRALIGFSSGLLATLAFKVLIPTSLGRSSLGVGADLSNGRFEIWGLLLDGLAQSPWLGYGALNTRLAQFAVADSHLFFKGLTIGSAHNIFLDIFVWFGIPFGLVLSFLLLKLVFNFFHAAKDTPILYLLIPLAVHSLLEFPLYNLYFFIFFIFIICYALPVKKCYPRLSIFSYIFFGISLVFSFVFLHDYKNLMVSYNNLRFFNRGFVAAENPSDITPIFLDVVTGQYNAFLKNQLNSSSEAQQIAALTPHSPSFNNFMLLVQYYRQKGDSVAVAYWTKKADAYLSSDYMKYVSNTRLQSLQPVQTIALPIASGAGLKAYKNSADSAQAKPSH